MSGADGNLVVNKTVDENIVSGIKIIMQMKPQHKLSGPGQIFSGNKNTKKTLLTCLTPAPVAKTRVSK